MPVQSPALTSQFHHALLKSGVELACDLLPDRDTVAIVFRMLTGVVEDPPHLTGVGSIVERTLSKGTQKYDGRALADAFDQLGVQWSTVTGRLTTTVRILCLPEFVLPATDLVAQMLRHPTFPEDACRVAVELALQDLKQLEDDPSDLVRLQIQKLTFGPQLGRFPGGEPESLPRIGRDEIVARWQRGYAAGRLQVAAAGPVDPAALAGRLEEQFGGWGPAEPAGREPAAYRFQPGRDHRHKDLKQQYLALTLPGAAKGDAEYPIEQVLLGVLSGGMSSRLFTEVREKQGLVYSVAAWHEHLRGSGVIYLSASSTPERVQRTYETLLRELARVGEDLTEAEVQRARDGLIAHMSTEDDLTRARAGNLSDDLFHFGRPIGPAPKVAALRAVTPADVERYARRLPLAPLCVATLGPRELS